MDLGGNLCTDADRRRREKLAEGVMNGIDEIELDAGHDGVPPRRTVLVRCLEPLPDSIGPDQVEVTSRHQPPGRPVAVTWAYRASDLAAAGADAGAGAGAGPGRPRAEDVAAFAAADDQLLVVRLDREGDRSPYLITLSGETFDPRLGEAGFSFAVDCPTDLDCRPVVSCPPPARPQPVIDYLNRDFTGLRRLLLDRLSVVSPEWADRSPADLGVTLVEIFAYLGDYLAAAQDAVAAEAYLGTARQRISLARHARLLDYRVHQGCAARVWLVLQVTDDVSAGYLHRTGCLPEEEIQPMIPAGHQVRSADGSVTFHTLYPVSPRAARNAIEIYTWDGQDCCLPVRATATTLAASHDELGMVRGDVLVLEQVREAEGGAGLDVTRRWPVRLAEDPQPLTDPLHPDQPLVRVRWLEQDALPFPLCIRRIPRGRCLPDEGVAIARGNVVLAGHGTLVEQEPVIPEQVPVRGRYRPVLRSPGLAFAVPYTAAQAVTEPAVQALRPDPREAVADLIRLDDGRDDWALRPDLLGSDRFAPDVVVEPDDEGWAHLRFGDDVSGRRPAAGRRFSATYRVGGGRAGNIGREVLTELDPPVPGVSVRNPMPAAGGIDPESAEQVRQFAPAAFRVQRRAVTDDDYAAAAMAEPGVQRAVATRRWTGSWYTEYVTVDRLGREPLDQALRDRLTARLDTLRMAGGDVQVAGPVYVSLEIVLTVCVRPEYVRSAVRATLVERFSTRDLPGGARGFFHPDNLTFAQPVYLSTVVAAAMAVPGVRWVDATPGPPGPNRFQRWGVPPAQEAATGRIQLGRLEVARCDSEATDPADGQIRFRLTGGL